MRLFTSIAGVSALASLVVPLQVYAKKPSKEERRQEKLRADLESADPLSYCEAVLTFRPRGFYPYCSGSTYPQVQHSFTANAALQAFKGVTVEWRQEGERRIPIDAGQAEKMLIDSVKSQAGPVADLGCLNQQPAACIQYLASRFLVSTAPGIPFYDWRSQASFDPEKSHRKMLEVQLLLPHTDSKSFVRDFGWNDTSTAFDAVSISSFVVDGKIESLTISGRYPILSDNPLDYEGSNFAGFMKSLFSSCDTENETEFYKAFWRALVKPMSYSKDNGKWRVNSSGLSKSYTGSSEGEICGLRVSSLSASGQNLTEEGKLLRGSTTQITFRLPKTGS